MRKEKRVLIKHNKNNIKDKFVFSKSMSIELMKKRKTLTTFSHRFDDVMYSSSTSALFFVSIY